MVQMLHINYNFLLTERKGLTDRGRGLQKRLRVDIPQYGSSKKS